MSEQKNRRGGPIPRPAIDRFRERFVIRDCGFQTPCWVWHGSTDRGGYGYLSTGLRTGRKIKAHRFAYEHFVGPVPEGLELDHLCRNHGCVNPTHLEPVTRRENLIRGDTFAARAARKTHCKHGHPFDEANTYIAKNGTRHCRACGREHAYRKYHDA